MDSTFPRRYEYEQLEELPGSPSYRHLYFPGASTSGGSDGVLLRICPAKADPWIGTFAFGRVIGMNGLTRVLTTPNPDVMCVVAEGAGYLVTVDAPETWSQVQAVPVLDVRQIPSCGLIVFSDFTDLVAYENSGLRWRERLGADGLQIDDVSDTEIRGTWWNPATQKRDYFAVDAMTGSLTSGFRWQ